MRTGAAVTSYADNNTLSFNYFLKGGVSIAINYVKKRGWGVIRFHSELKPEVANNSVSDLETKN